MLDLKYKNSIMIAICFAETLVTGIINTFIRIPNISVILMLVLLSLAVFFNRSFLSQAVYFLITSFVILALLGISMLVNFNTHIINYALYFIAFGMTASFLLSTPYDYKTIIDSLLVIYTIHLSLYFFINRRIFLQSENYWEQQMGKAYALVLIIVTTVAFIIYQNVYKCNLAKKIWLFSIAAIALYALIVDCATRGALVTIAISVIVLLIGKTNDRTRILLIILLAVPIFMIINNYEEILINLSNFFSSHGIEIPALKKMIFMLKQDRADNGRNFLYVSAWEYFKTSPIIGKGIGYFENIHGIYVHNFFLEILCEYGLVGFVVVVSFLLKNIIYFISGQKDIEKVFNMALFCAVMPMLFFSSSYWKYPTFWLYFFWVLAPKSTDALKMKQGDVATL